MIQLKDDIFAEAHNAIEEGSFHSLEELVHVAIQEWYDERLGKRSSRIKISQFPYVDRALKQGKFTSAYEAGTKAFELLNKQLEHQMI